MTPEALQELDNMVIDETELVSSICRESFYEFVLEMWDTVVTAKFKNNWHIKYLCDEVQIVTERMMRGEPLKYNLAINISPGESKSSLISILLPSWTWTRKPDAGIIGSSHGYNLALEMNRQTRTVIRSDKYKKYFSEIKIMDDQNAKGYFRNTAGGIRVCVGVDGDITGWHGDLLLVDDPIDPKGARSEAEIASANIFLKEVLSTRKKEKAVTPIIMIMQRLSEDDCTGMMLNKWDIPVKHICIPAEITDDIKPPELIKNYVNGLMDPLRLSQKVLDEQKLSGEFFYAGQFLQSPIPLGGAMFHVERINIEKAAPVRDIKIVRYWDKAGTKDGGAYSVGVKMGRDKEQRIWILDVVRGQWDSGTREKHIKLTTIMDGKPVLVGIEQEPGSGGKESAENTVKNLLGYRVRVDRPTGDKAQRADPFSTQVNNGNVYMVEAPWNHAYIEELRFFSLLNSKYKDQVDASSGAFKILTEPIMRVGGGFLKQG